MNDRASGCSSTIVNFELSRSAAGIVLEGANRARLIARRAAGSLRATPFNFSRRANTTQETTRQEQRATFVHSRDYTMQATGPGSTFNRQGESKFGLRGHAWFSLTAALLAVVAGDSIGWVQALALLGLSGSLAFITDGLATDAPICMRRHREGSSNRFWPTSGGQLSPMPALNRPVGSGLGCWQNGVDLAYRSTRRRPEASATGLRVCGSL